ncbi:acyltransferase domain-containing protein [Acinetobacter sp. ANC 4173]|uniref:acyltransferase domain-containing protein n=1 Tax=Acinetobacter sp. ANC 4173 TaxID=2529837 RepID=UPI00103A0B94|nr:acyltransferase domain-containing protein [Acinetobacter sp. ANC 4173]TCB79582.1 acyltransferase domain-containing protein [Acinetobacter sp. ANC 4173]
MNFAILFSGQGVQNLAHVQQLKDLATELNVTSQLTQCLPTLFNPNLSEADLYSNDFAQPFIFALQWCRWQKLKHKLDEIISFSGYSLGELSALICSTEISFEQGLYLARQRGMLMSEAGQESSGLLAVQGINWNGLELLLAKTATELSIKISDSHFIVGGLEANLQQLTQQLEQVGTHSVKRLNVSIPSHTSLMNCAVAPYRQVLQQHQFNRLEVAIISGSGGHKYYKTSDAVEALIDQMNHAIDWDSCLTAIQENQPDIVLEIGPGNALSKMLLERSPHLNVRAVDDFKTFQGLELWIEKQQNIDC